MKVLTVSKNIIWVIAVILFLAVIVNLLQWQTSKRPPAILLISQDATTGSVLFGREIISRSFIMQLISEPELLNSLRTDCHWQVSDEEMLEKITVKQRLSGSNSYLLEVNAGNNELSWQVARRIAQYILSHSRVSLSNNPTEKINRYRAETVKMRKNLQQIREILDANEHDEVLDNDVGFYNRQLEYNENRLIGLYTAYLGQYDNVHIELKIKLDMLLQELTEEDFEVKVLQMKLDAIEKQRNELAASLKEYQLNLYTDKTENTVNLPADIQWLMKNIREIRRKKTILLAQEEKKKLESELTERQMNEEKMGQILSGNGSDILITPMNSFDRKGNQQ